MDPLPDLVRTGALLAIAKDSRYVQNAEQLLREALAAVAGDSTDPLFLDDGPLLWATPVATLFLYVVLVVRRNRQTAGMEVCGLSFERFSLWRALMGVVGYGALHYSLHVDERRASANGERERLTGASRRQVFEQQRDAMRRRIAQGTTAAISPSQQNEVNKAPAKVAPNNLTWKHHLRKLFRATLALSPGFSGPHAVSILDNRATDWETLFLWVARFHLALFCWRGGFPSFLHRFVYQSRMKSAFPVTDAEGNLRHAGLLLGAYSGSAILLILARKAVAHLAARHSPQGTVSAPAAALEMAHDASKDTIAIRSTCVCNICGQERDKPACSIRCGHVFCWTCLQRWLATTAQACPLCRKPCGPRDIILLRNYDGMQSGAN